MLETKKKHHAFVYFSYIIADNLKTLGICFRIFSLLNSRVYISCFAKVTKDFHEIPSLLRIWDAPRVSATVKQAEGMWKHEAIWLLVTFTGSRGH